MAPLGALLGGVVARADVTLPFLLGGGASALAGLVMLRRFSRIPEPEALGATPR